MGIINENCIVHPSTIHSPKSFDDSQFTIECPHCHRLIGFDGIFDWWWVNKTIKKYSAQSNITPMDFDGVIERNFNYIIFETKDEGVEIPQGQLWTLERLIYAKSICIMKVWGKKLPVKYESIIYFKDKPPVKEEEVGYKAAMDYVYRWFKWANEHT